jgi:hypothetical protein
LDSDGDWNYAHQGDDWKMGVCSHVSVIGFLGRTTKSINIVSKNLVKTSTRISLTYDYDKSLAKHNSDKSLKSVKFKNKEKMKLQVI